MATDALELRVSDALKRAPFVIFSKEAPASLDDFSMDDSFQYFYFNDLMQTLSGLSPSFLTNGRNAKTDFPEDFEAYFSDDVDVCKSFLHPKIKTLDIDENRTFHSVRLTASLMSSFSWSPAFIPFSWPCQFPL